MRLTFLIHSLDIGGTERLVVDLVRRFRSEVEITVCCLDYPGVWGEDLRREGTAVYALRRKPGIDFGTAWRLGSLLRRQRTDLIHCHQYPAFFYGALGAVLSPSTRVLFTEHGRAYPDIVSRRRVVVNRLLVRLTHSITAVSHAVKQAMVRLDRMPEAHIQVITNGVDPRRYMVPPDVAAAQRMALGIGREDLVLGTVGRLDPVKDHLTLVRAFAKIRKIAPEVRLLIAGDGETRKSLEDEIQMLNLGKAVSLLGFRNDVPLLLAAFDVFVLPSRNESMSVTLLEAMAAGLPVVVTAVGDNPRIVDQGVSGLLCPPEDPESLADSLIALLRNPSGRERMGRAGRERVRVEFTTDRMVESYRTLYREVMAHWFYD